MMNNGMSGYGMMGRGMMGHRGMMMGGMQGGMMRMMHARMLTYMNNPRSRMMMSVYILPSLNSLNLKSSQKSKLAKLKSDYLKKIQNSRNSILDLQNKLNSELASSSLDINKVRNLIKQRAEEQGNLQLAMINTYHTMMSVLNSSQQKQLRGMSSQDYMNAMYNNVTMSQMTNLCPFMGGSYGNGRMMNGMMGSNMMYGNYGNKSNK